MSSFRPRNRNEKMIRELFVQSIKMAEKVNVATGKEQAKVKLFKANRGFQVVF